MDTVAIVVGSFSVPGSLSALRDTICQGTPGRLSISGGTTGNLQWQSSTNDMYFTDIAGATDTINYKTPPLLQTTWYRATVGTGGCSAISDTLELFVPPALSAFFSYTVTSGKLVQFNSDSSSGKIKNYHWDFGDGATSNDSNPSHTFADDSTYYVCLTLYDGSNCSYTFCRYTSIVEAVENISAAGQWNIYPNPFNNQLTVISKQLSASNKIQSIEMYDVLGQLVLSKYPGDETNTSLKLDVTSLAKGMYFVMIRTSEANYVQKVVKQ
jgi:PKD repeat protein